MNKLAASLLAISMTLSAPAVFAGGPVIVEDSIEEVAQQPASSVGILPVVIMAVALCAALCGQGDPEPETCVKAIAC